jgi:hypothetical protein
VPLGRFIEPAPLLLFHHPALLPLSRVLPHKHGSPTPRPVTTGHGYAAAEPKKGVNSVAIAAPIQALRANRASGLASGQQKGEPCSPVANRGAVTCSF